MEIKKKKTGKPSPPPRRILERNFTNLCMLGTTMCLCTAKTPSPRQSIFPGSKANNVRFWVINWLWRYAMHTIILFIKTNDLHGWNGRKKYICVSDLVKQEEVQKDSVSLLGWEVLAYVTVT